MSRLRRHGGKGWAVGFAVLVGLGATIAFSWVPSRRLPDGSRFAIVETRFQDGFRYTIPVPWWQRWLARVLPANSPWRGRVGFRGGGGISAPPTGTPQLFVVTAQSGVPASGAIQLERIWVRDADGSVFETVSDALTVGWPGHVDQVWPLRAFPRRGSHLTLQFIASGPDGKYRPAAEFRVRNPVPGPHPVWTPEPLPIRRTSAELPVALVDFEAGVAHDDSGNRYWTGRRTTRVTFEGPSDPAWELRELQVSDATGNRWIPNLEWPPDSVAPGRRVAEFIGALWPGEAAWKLRVEFARTNGFAVEDIARVDLRIPEAGEWQALDRSVEAGGVAVTLVGIGGAKADLPAPFGPLRMAEGVGIALHVGAGNSGRRVRVGRVIDDRGRPLPVREGFRWSPEDQVYSLEVPDGARTLSVELAAPVSRVMEFLAVPRQVGK